MLVETFEVEEVSSESHPEVESAAVELIESLGLEGQKKLLTTHAETGVKTRQPYRLMTAEEEFVWKILCPRRTELKDFASGPIPLRILQVAAHAKDCGMFQRLEVWHPQDASDPDPVLVGLAMDNPHVSGNRPYYLARWGDVLEEFPTLLKRAYTRNRDAVIEELRQIKGKVEAKLAAAKEIPNGEPTFTLKAPHFYDF